MRDAPFRGCTIAAPPDDHTLLVPMPEPVPRARAVRGTVIVASLRALNDAGLHGAYRSALDAQHREGLQAPLANSWLPIDLAMAHYDACDALGLSLATIDELGRTAGTSVNAVFLQSMLKLAADPLFAWTHAQRIWARGWDGSAVGVTRAGPKDVLVTVAGFPCARFGYVQRALLGFFVRNTELFCRKAHAQLLQTGPELLRYGVSWV
jgi:hypothetical protein